MKKRTKLGLGLLTLGLTLGLAACGSSDSSSDKTKESSSAEKENTHTVAIITDVGGIDDKSFNQSAWEGLKEWGKENGIEEGAKGYSYIQSDDASQYATNIDSGISSGFKTLFGIGYLLKPAIETAATQNPDVQFGLIDEVIEGKDNVVSATFKDHESAYLAGIAAAYTTKTNKVGFVGGEEGMVIDRFHAGFVRGVEDAAKELGKDITVDARYAASFGDPAKGKALAAQMYQNGVDIIYHAAGGTGTGVFQEARALNEKKSADDRVWVIGVDRDQVEDGQYKDKDGNEQSFTLTSTTKGVGAAVKDISNRALKGEFPGGEHLIYGLAEGGVDIVLDNLSDEAKAKVEEAKEKVINGDIKDIPETPKK